MDTADPKVRSERHSKAIQQPREKPTRPAPRRWMPDEDQVIRDNYLKSPGKLKTLLPTRSVASIYERRMSLGLRKIVRFTDDDDAFIKAGMAAFTPLEDIAVKLGRSHGVIRQRVMFLGLHRDGRKTRLAKKYGLDALSISSDPIDIVQHFEAIERQKKADDVAKREREITAVLDAMNADLANGGDRRIAYQLALTLGATLQQIGDRVGVTRERVRQVANDVKRGPQAYIRRPLRQIECRQCGTTFMGHGNRAYCDDLQCRENQQTASIECARQYHRKLRRTPSAREYKRKWTAKARAKEKLLAMSRNDLADVLSDLAASIKSTNEV